MDALKKTVLLLFVSLALSACYERDAQYFFDRGNDAFISREYTTAIENMNAALRLKPDFCVAYFTRASSFFSIGNYADALKDYTNAIACDPKYAIAYRFRGVVKVELGDTVNAYKDWMAARAFGDIRAEHYLRIYRKHLPGELKDTAR